MENIQFICIPHAAWVPRTGTDPSEGLLGLAAVRYYRFGRPVRVGLFRLHPTKLRFAPDAYTRPDHVRIARFMENHGWETIADLHLPVIPEDEWHEIDLGGVETDHLRVLCDYEHPAEECHGDFAYAQWNVPFRILEDVEWLGEPMESEKHEPPYAPPLKMGVINPSAPDGMEMTCYEGREVSFRSPSFSVAFGLRRPLITSLAWDVLGSGLVDRSLTCHDSRLARRFNGQWPSDLISGPWFSGLRQEASCLYWGGEVSVEGNRIAYRDLHLIEGLTLNVTFTVFSDGMDVSIDQHVEHDIYAPEYEAWRFMWNAEESIIGTLSMPINDTGRTGLVGLPALWNAPGHGTMLLRQVDGDPVCLQVDSVRDQHFGMSGIMLGTTHDEYGLVTILKGEYHAALSMRIYELLPKLAEDTTKDALAPGLRRNWSTIFTFRPELGGFSNNSMSVICHVSQKAVTDACACTPVPEGVPSPLEMVRYTVSLAMKGGPGYGEIRNMFMDSDPGLLCAAGRIHQADPNEEWLREMSPWIKAATQRILNQMDEEGLYLCKRLSGNSGSAQWSSNAFDVVSFGHHDAYSNALAYRGLRNAAAMIRDAGDLDLAGRCIGTADGIKAAYVPCFYNSDTGWLGGWRSRDGELHDYGFTFINAMAICYGLMEDAQARAVLERLEAKRKKIGLGDFHYGLPLNLISIRKTDVPAEQQGKRVDGLDMYGVYLNGALSTAYVDHYLAALSKYGFKETADKICDHLEESLANNRIVGGIFTGTEFFTWDGAPCGYEGVLGMQFSPLRAIAQHRGLVPRLEPEWWPIPSR